MIRKRDLSFTFGERCRWLIENDDAQLRDQDPGDGDELTLRDTELVQSLTGIYGKANARHEGAGSFPLPAPVNDGTEAHLIPESERDVFHHGQARNECRLLMNEADAVLGRTPRVLDRDRLPIQQDFSGVGAILAGEHLDQGRLACTVFADQGVDLAGADHEADVVDGKRSRERLGDASQLKDGRRCRRQAGSGAAGSSVLLPGNGISVVISLPAGYLPHRVLNSDRKS